MKTKPKMLCKTCEGMVAASAKACPHCGAMYSSGFTLVLKILGVLAVMQGAWLLQYLAGFASHMSAVASLLLVVLAGFIIGGFIMIAMAEKIRRSGMRAENEPAATAAAPKDPVMRKPPARKRAGMHP